MDGAETFLLLYWGGMALFVVVWILFVIRILWAMVKFAFTGRF